MTRTFNPHGDITHLHVLPDGNYVALLRRGIGDAVVVGVPGETMRAIPASRVSVQRDGGTMTAFTAEGRFHVPASGPFGKTDAGPATWAGQAVAPARKSGLAITLDESGVTIEAPRPPAP